MRYLTWVDGRILDSADIKHDRPYVMQRVHTLAYKAYDVGLHLGLLRDASEQMFGFASLCSDADAEDIIRVLLTRARVTQTLSCPVVVRIDSTGVLSFEVETPTFGAGCYLRAKRYEAVAVVCDVPTTEVQTSISVVSDMMADSRVKMYGGEVAIWIDREHNLISRPWRPLFVAYRNKVYTPSEHYTVEYLRAVQAIRRAGYEFEIRTIPERTLDRVDEVFTVDIMSVSAYSRIVSHRLLSSVSTRVAANMILK